MIGYIITGICCFTIGSITGIICISLCSAGKSQDDTETPIDDCYGCLGASFGDCELVQRKETVKMKNRLLKKILIAVMECVFILACCFVVLVIFCMWLFSHTGV